MDAILERTNEAVRAVLESWETVDTVTVMRFGADRYDPSFFISYDVYYHGTVPEPADRETAFAFGVAYESTVDGQKDRFLFEDVPVRVEYKAISEVDVMIGGARQPERGDVAGTTYGFYRLVNSDLLFSRSKWIDVVRTLLAEIPESFWERRVRVLRAHMEHALSDLTSAAYGDEQLFYQLSLARFLETSCNLLLAIHRTFEPAGRSLHEAVRGLDRLPEEFESRFDYLLSHDPTVRNNRKREIAQLIARSLLRMS